MTETLKTHETEGSAPETEWDTLRTVEFRGKHEKPPKEERKTEYVGKHLKKEAVKPVGELSHEEARDEYLDILKDLSKSFTEQGDYGHGGAELTSLLMREKVGDEAFLSEEGEYTVGNTGNLRVADALIAGEAAWRASGEKYEKKQAAYEEAKQNLQDYRHKEKEMGFFQKAFSVRKRRKERQELEGAYMRARHAMDDQLHSNRNINTYIKRRLESAYGKMPNDEANDKFFGPQNDEKIDRAIELYRKLVEEEAEKRKGK